MIGGERLRVVRPSARSVASFLAYKRSYSSLDFFTGFGEVVVAVSAVAVPRRPLGECSSFGRILS